jgi:hypothetical protein
MGRGKFIDRGGGVGGAVGGGLPAGSTDSSLLIWDSTTQTWRPSGVNAGQEPAIGFNGTSAQFNLGGGGGGLFSIESATQVLHRYYPTNVAEAELEGATVGAATALLWQYQLPYADMVLTAQAYVMAFETTAPATDAGAWLRSTVYKRRASSVATIVGANASPPDWTRVDAGSAALVVAFTTDGNFILRVSATGIAARNYNWRGFVRYTFNEA